MRPETPAYLEALINPTLAARFGFPRDPQARLAVIAWMRFDPAPGVQALLRKAWAQVPKETQQLAWDTSGWTLA